MTTVLYPRLLDAAARELHQRHRAASIADLGATHALRHPSAVFAATGGRRVTDDELADLRARIVRVAEYAGYPGEGRRQDRAGFDVEVARLLHERSGLVAAEASVRSIWAFLALVVLPDIAYWRYPHAPLDRVLGTDITRHVFGRLWWRAHLLLLPDPTRRYDLLDTFGEAAFDQIFARRRSVGGSRALVRALADVWPTTPRAGVNDRELLRDALKRLLRRSAMIEFEALDDHELRAQVTEVLNTSAAVLDPAGPSVRHRLPDRDDAPPA